MESNILKKLEASQKRRTNSLLQKVIQNYNLDVRQIQPNMLWQLNNIRFQDEKQLDQRAAKVIHGLTKKVALPSIF